MWPEHPHGIEVRELVEENALSLTEDAELSAERGDARVMREGHEADVVLRQRIVSSSRDRVEAAEEDELVDPRW